MSRKSKPAILYVDDEHMNLELFTLTFSNDFTPFTADSGANALQVLEEHPHIQFFISDIGMPYINGIDLIKSVKALKPKLPCILISGYDISDCIETALQEKLIEQYFMKPYNIAELKAFISKYV